MGPSPPTGPAAPRQVTVIGHHSQIVPTVGFFVGGSIQVRVYTSKADLEHQLAPYPGVHVTVVPAGYLQRPADLPEPPYFIAAETEEESLRIKEWLPPTVAVFQILNDDRNALQHSPISAAAVQSAGAVKATSLAISQVAAISRLRSLTVNGSQPSPCRSIRRRRCGCGSEKSQVPPASQASPDVQCGNCARVVGCATSVIVFKSMDTLAVSRR